MLKRVFSAGMFILLSISLLTLAFNIQPAKSNPTTITVPDDYATIQEAVNAANPGDTIFVKAGLYYENVVVNKTLSLIGENKETTILSGQGNDVFNISANHVKIMEFTITDGWYGIYIYKMSGNTVMNSNITNMTSAGIYLEESANNTLSYNAIAQNTRDIVLTNSSNNVLNENVIADSLDGVSLVTSFNNSLFGNVVNNNRMGIELYGACNNNLFGNIVSNNLWEGIAIGAISYPPENTWVNSSSNILNNNIVNNNLAGITISGMNHSLHGNTLENNEYGIELAGVGNLVFHNNFVNNTNQATAFEGLDNIWDNGYSSGGNYWSDYTGTDLSSGPYQNMTGSDGIGDTHYVIDVNNQDRYPLMQLYVPLIGDLNLDGIVDILDALLGASAFGSYPGHPNWNGQVDLNQNNVIDILDMIILANNFGKHQFTLRNIRWCECTWQTALLTSSGVWRSAR